MADDIWSRMERDMAQQAKARSSGSKSTSDMMDELYREAKQALGEQEMREPGRDHADSKAPKRDIKTVPPVKWDDILGQDKAKQQLQEAVEASRKHKSLYDFYKMQPPKGILLYGPPGCGKTMLARAVATSLRDDPSLKDSVDAFQHIKGPELHSRYVGESEEKIRDIFNRSRKHAAKNGYPGIIFLDECDSLLTKRGEIHYMNSMVNQFLTEMDGMEAANTIVIMATNRHKELDPAVLREGRTDYKICVERPSQQAAVKIISSNLAGLPIAKKQGTVEELAEYAAGNLYKEELLLEQVNTNEGLVDFTFANVISGAMLAGICNQAKSVAFRRDLEQGKESGMIKADLTEAMRSVVSQNAAMDQSENIAMFLEGRGLQRKGGNRK